MLLSIRQRLPGAAFVAALVLAGSVQAQPAPAKPQPTAEQIAAARAEADAIIRKANAADLFDNITDSNIPTLRHKASGLVCGFEPGAKVNHVTVYEGTSDALPRGDDVSCETRMADFDQSIYVTRWRERYNTDQALQIAVSAIHQRWPAAQSYSGQSATMSTKADPAPHKTARFIVEVDGRKLYTRASTATVGDWSILERTTGPADNALAGDLLGETTLMNLLDKLVQPKAF